MKIKSIILIFMLSLMFGMTALAEKVQVTGTNVNLRLSPSLNGSVYCNSYGVPIRPRKGEILYWTGTAKMDLCKCNTMAQRSGYTAIMPSL